MTSTSVKMIRSLSEDGGEGSYSNPLKFNDQDYEQLKEMLLSEEGMFEDETFPASLESLGKLEDYSAEKLNEVEWLRPYDLHSDALFVVDGASRFDFGQGDVGNCWFLSSIGALTFRKSLLAHVVPMDQSFKDGYAGIFHFKLWRFGKWVDVVIDDLLPTHNKVPVSVSSKSKKEFWAPLLEKAYAKVCGSYADMIAGNPPEAFKDFSGGVNMDYTLAKSPSDLWDIINRATQSNPMMGCGTFGEAKGTEISKNYGLVEGHAFAVTGVRQVESEGNTVNLVRIWNPWGNTEWKGDWSDKSQLWNTVSGDVRDECLKVRNDGEFWMKLKDFCEYFEDFHICCDSPNFVDDDPACVWNCSMKEGRWEVGESAGGPHVDREEFWTNPQCRLTLKENKGGKNVLMSLVQKPDEEHRRKVTYHSIGFIVYKVPPEAPKGRLSSSLFQYISVFKMSTFTQARELIELHSWEPGEYLIVPCTFEPNKTSSFIVTIYSKAEAELE